MSHICLTLCFVYSFFLCDSTWIFSVDLFLSVLISTSGVSNLVLNPSNSQLQIFFRDPYLLNALSFHKFISVLTYLLGILNSTHNLFWPKLVTGPTSRPGMQSYLVEGRYRERNVWGTALMITTLG